MSDLPVQARRAVSPLADDAARAREDMLRSRVVALTGSPDGDRALAELYEGYEDEEKRRRALELYVKEDKSFEEIAAKLEADIRRDFHKLMSNQSRIAAKAAGRAVDVSADDFEG